MTRTFVVGLDGASWRLLKPWIEAGELPNLAALRKKGTWAESQSCLPPVTFPNWKCYSSGKDPGGLGVFWFEQVDLHNGQIKVVNGSDFHTAELWDYLNDEGYTTGVINMPTMYPPREIDGFIVCGGPDAVEGEYRSINTGYTVPANLAQELETRFDYRVHPEPLLSSNDERGAEVDAILDLFDARFEAALSLFEERDLDFIHLTLFYINVLHHFFWDNEPTKRGWTCIDKWLGRLAEVEDTNVVLISDHGSAPTTTEFYINEWLAETGYQTRQRTIEDYLQPLGLTRENALRIAKHARLVDFLERTIPQRLQRLIPQEAGLKRARKLEAIDLKQTKAVASSQGPVYLNPDFDTEVVREDLIADLQNVEDEEGFLFTDVHCGEEIYTGSYVEKGPEVVVDQRPGIHVNDGLGSGNIHTKPDRWAAENTRSGIFLTTGPSFESYGEIDQISILDIAPTLLVNAGCDVPTDMQGSVLSILNDPPPWEWREPIDIDEVVTQNASDQVSDRLKQLGYME